MTTYILVPPDIIDSESTSDVIIREGNNVVLNCKANGSPEPEIHWRREDGQKIQVNKTIQGTHYSPYLK